MSDNVVKVGQLRIRYLVDGSENGGLGVFELEVPPGSFVPPPHSHTKNEECVYVLEGLVVLYINSTIQVLIQLAP